MTHSITTTQALRDLEWNREQAAASRMIAAQEKMIEGIAPKTLPLTIAQVTEGFDFSLDEFNTRYSFDGKCVQAGMRLISKTSAADRYLVVAKLINDETRWYAYCPRNGWQNANAIICAVQNYIESRKNRAIN